MDSKRNRARWIIAAVLIILSCAAVTWCIFEVCGVFDRAPRPAPSPPQEETEPSIDQLLQEAYYEGYHDGKIAGLGESDPFV